MSPILEFPSPVSILAVSQCEKSHNDFNFLLNLTENRKYKKIEGLTQCPKGMKKTRKQSEKSLTLTDPNPDALCSYDKITFCLRRAWNISRINAWDDSDVISQQARLPVDNHTGFWESKTGHSNNANDSSESRWSHSLIITLTTVMRETHTVCSSFLTCGKWDRGKRNRVCSLNFTLVI